MCIRDRVDLGVTMVADYAVKDLLADQAEGGFEAVFVAIGAHLSKRVDIPNRDASRICLLYTSRCV